MTEAERKLLLLVAEMLELSLTMERKTASAALLGAARRKVIGEAKP